MRMKKLWNVSNKSMVILTSSLLISFLIGLVVFTAVSPSVYAVKPLCGDECPPEICDNGIDDDDDSLIDCADDECYGYDTGEECGGIGCIGTWTCNSDGTNTEYCSSVGDYCGDCDLGPDCVLAGPSYTIDVYYSGAWYCTDQGMCDNECVYDQYCLDDDYSDGFYTFGCGAPCDGYGIECEDYCVGDTLYIGSCDLWPGDCTCDYDPYDCNNDDGWYDTENTRWVDIDQCNEKEQKEQEWRDYGCFENEIVGCDYTVTDTRWIDTENTRNKQDGTSCDDGLFCTVDDVCTAGTCGGGPRDCSDENECTYDVCKEELDQCENPHMDETEPETTKEYGEPLYTNDVEWITSDTLITLTAIDYGLDGRCAIGVENTYWRNTLLEDDMPCWDDDYCQEEEGEGEFNVYEEPFTKGEESCHLIEYWSEDALDNKEEVKKQCVFVDNTGPTPVKEVGDPSTECEGDQCEVWDWLITLYTPITLDCLDEGDHPVGEETLCYKIYLDGEDMTEEYCDGLTDGWCCIEPPSEEIWFEEECSHRIEFYCTDELGNEGPTDDEIFKVEGGVFTIQLNKKWNLISVPFVLLNDDITELLEGISGIESVWTYDGEADEWYSYTPDGIDNDDLFTVTPGWGYWIKMSEPNELLIGGSLFQPKVTPPIRKLMPGWNLIGYYGTDGETVYDYPDGDGKEAYCALYSLVNTNSGLPRWSSLVTYWEPDNPFQWKYLDQYNEMDPGAGYWTEMDMEDNYAPATVCPD